MHCVTHQCDRPPMPDRLRGQVEDGKCTDALVCGTDDVLDGRHIPSMHLQQARLPIFADNLCLLRAAWRLPTSVIVEPVDLAGGAHVVAEERAFAEDEILRLRRRWQR